MADDPKDIERCKPQFPETKFESVPRRPGGGKAPFPVPRVFGSLVLAAAVQAIASNVKGKGIEPPRSIADEIRAHAGEPEKRMQVIGVGPGHEHEPAPQKFNVVDGVCYVRVADLPKLQRALAKQRAQR